MKIQKFDKAFLSRFLHRFMNKIQVRVAEQVHFNIGRGGRDNSRDLLLDSFFDIFGVSDGNDH